MKCHFFQKTTTPVISSSQEVVFRVGNGVEALLNQVSSHSACNQFSRIWGGGHDDDIMRLLETRNLGQCVWKLMTLCLPAFVECLRETKEKVG